VLGGVNVAGRERGAVAITTDIERGAGVDGREWISTYRKGD